MSCFISELLIPEDGGLLWVDCQRCRRRQNCSFAQDQALRRAARQGHTAARRLAAEADQLLEIISDADDVCGLLGTDDAVERVLSQTLCAEMALIGDLCVQTT